MAVQQQPPIEGEGQDPSFDTTPPTVAPVVPTFVPAPTTVLPTVPHPAPTPAAVPAPLLQPGNNWAPATDLVTRDDGRLLQTAQSREINKYISKTVRLANMKIFFVDAFPDPEKQNNWLSGCFVTVLEDRAQTDNVAREVNLRARQDPQYMSALISMVC